MRAQLVRSLQEPLHLVGLRLRVRPGPDLLRSGQELLHSGPDLLRAGPDLLRAGPDLLFLWQLRQLRRAWLLRSPERHVLS
jgi:hypothetical protein